MSNYIVSVTIGRNVGDKPMSAGEWSEFRTMTERVAAKAFAFHVVRPEGWEIMSGTGAWRGVAEECFRVAGFGLEESDAVSVAATLRERVTVLCDLYDQDAIAVTVGETTLV